MTTKPESPDADLPDAGLPHAGLPHDDLVVFTIGHSNLALADFLALLRTNGIEAIADIRRFPGSRKWPHFNQENLAAALEEHGIGYHWVQSLGGRRKSSKEFSSPNLGLRNESFRSYADYMLTEQFDRGAAELLEIARSRPTAMMCAESVFWRCHRRLVSDFLVARGILVQHIFPSGEAKPHVLTAEARIQDGAVTYPAPPSLFEEEAH